jgi:glycosyltransferase involved in cell wall biosynthesis
MKPVISVVMPAYNEEATIRESVLRCLSVLREMQEPFEIIIVDDGSIDRTSDVVRSIESPDVILLNERPNAGKGKSLKDGWCRSSGRYVCFIDADLDIDSRGLRHFYSRITSIDLPVDAVVGSKTHPDSRVQYPLGRRVQSKAFKMVVRVLFGLAISDTQTGLKLFRRELLDDCLPLVLSEGFTFDLELLALAQKKGYRLVEEPVHVDFQFTSTVGLRTAWIMLVDTFRIRRRLRSEMVNPSVGDVGQ